MIEHDLVIDSRYFSNKHSSTHFTFNLNDYQGYPGKVYKKVVSVELTAFSLNSSLGFSEFNTEHYFILDIEELNNRVLSNVPHANGSFAVLYYMPYRRPNKYDSSRDYLNIRLIKGKDFDNKIRTFDIPLDSLSRLSVRLKSASTFDLLQFSPLFFTMKFKITTLI